MGSSRKGRGGKDARTRDREQRVLSGERCPCGKVRFLSKADAKKTITRMKGRSGRMHAYRCTDPLGGEFWHVGHVPVDLKRGWVSRDDVEARRVS
jgi:hypothetical protein